MNDTVIKKIEHITLDSRGHVSLLYFHAGQVLMITESSVGLFPDRNAIDNPLASALGYEAIPAGLQPNWDSGAGFVERQQAGFVALRNGGVLFLRPDGVALYPDGDAALHNRDQVWLISYQPS